MMFTALYFSSGKSLSRCMTATRGCLLNLSVRLKLVSHTTCKKGAHPCNWIHWHTATTICFNRNSNLTLVLDFSLQNTVGCLAFKLTTINLSHNLTLQRVLSQSTAVSSKERVDLLVALLLLLLLLVAIWPG